MSIATYDTLSPATQRFFDRAVLDTLDHWPYPILGNNFASAVEGSDDLYRTGGILAKFAAEGTGDPDADIGWWAQNASLNLMVLAAFDCGLLSVALGYMALPRVDDQYLSAKEKSDIDRVRAYLHDIEAEVKRVLQEIAQKIPLVSADDARQIALDEVRVSQRNSKSEFKLILRNMAQQTLPVSARDAWQMDKQAA
jgi:hypothetical protein